MALGRKTGGRKAGTPNKATAEVKALAASYRPEALDILMSIARTERRNPAARVAACKHILDLGADDGRIPVRMIVEWGESAA